MINQLARMTKFALPSRLSYWIPLIFFILTGGLLAILIFAILGYQILYLNRGYPGISVAGIEIAGMTQPEIEATIRTQTLSYLSRPITIQVDDNRWTFTGQELGLRVDTEATATQAYDIGRSGNLFVDMMTHLSLFFTPRQVEPIIQYDRGPTDEILHSLTALVDRPPQDAQLIIHPTGEIDVIPAQRGRRLHVGATSPLIEEAIFKNDDQPVIAFTQEVIPNITDEDVEAAYQEAKNLLAQPLVFSFNTDTDTAEWRLEPETVASMLNIVETIDADGESRLALELNQEKLAPHFEEFARAINQEPSDARLRFDEEAGELTVLQPSRDGRTLDIEAAYQETVAAVANGSHQIKLPVTLTPATISSDDLEALGIKELISESTSYFKGSSEGRMKNIALAASKFDGVVVPPGEIFSFNEHLGPVTAEAGYDESLIIFGDRTTVGIGGGVCQVSTTAFRAAFFGGFELVERWAHGYRVGWYEINATVGLDATIYSPAVDFKFRNDSDHYLLIQTETDLEAGTLTFKFYGTPMGREVIVSEPVEENVVKHDPPVYEETPKLPKGITKQVDWAKDGVDVTVTRVVKEGDTIIHEDEIFSHYLPWRAVYQVGTGG